MEDLWDMALVWFLQKIQTQDASQISVVIALSAKFGCLDFRKHKADSALLPRWECFTVKLPKSSACITLQPLGGPVNTSALQEQEQPVLTQGRISTATHPAQPTPATAQYEK